MNSLWNRLHMAPKSLLLVLVLVSSSSGCVHTWDKITSRRFLEKPRETLFVTPDPMVVLRESEDGDERIRAMLQLDAKAIAKLSSEDKEELFNICEKSAVADGSGLIRLAALETLNQMEDPRIPKILSDAYQAASSRKSSSIQPVSNISIGRGGVNPIAVRERLTQSNSTQFEPDMITKIECRVIEGMGKNRTQNELLFLCKIAGTPIIRRDISNMDPMSQTPLPIMDRFDLRMAAIRTLANYQGEKQAILTLTKVVTTEKDVAVLNRSFESLQKITGQKLDADSEIWKDWAIKNVGFVPEPENPKTANTDPKKLPMSLVLPPSANSDMKSRK